MDPKRTKLGPRGIKCDFIGYAPNSKAYRLLNFECNVIIESRDVKFFENLNTKDKEYESPTNKESREEYFSRNIKIQPESTSQIIETQPESRISKKVWKTKDLGPNETNSQLIYFYLVEGNCDNYV